MKFIDDDQSNIIKIEPLNIISIKNHRIIPNNIPDTDSVYMTAKIVVNVDGSIMEFIIAFNDENYICIVDNSIIDHLDFELTKKDKRILENTTYQKILY